MRIIKKYQYGGPTQALTRIGQQSAQEAAEDPQGDNSWKYFVPIIGTTQSMIDAFDSGSPFDYGLAGLSLLGDVFMGGSTKGMLSSAKNAYKAHKAGTKYLYKAAEPGLKQARLDLVESQKNLEALDKIADKIPGTENDFIGLFDKLMEAKRSALNDIDLAHALRAITPQHYLQDVLWYGLPIIPAYTPHILSGLQAWANKKPSESKESQKQTKKEK